MTCRMGICVINTQLTCFGWKERKGDVCNPHLPYPCRWQKYIPKTCISAILNIRIVSQCIASKCSDWVPILYLITIWLTPSFCRNKIGLSLSYLVPEIPEPKVGLIFHQNVLFIKKNKKTKIKCIIWHILSI